MMCERIEGFRQCGGCLESMDFSAHSEKEASVMGLARCGGGGLFHTELPEHRTSVSKNEFMQVEN